MYIHKTSQRGASLVETSLSMALVALVTVAAIRSHGARICAILGQDLVGALGGKPVTMIAGVPNTDGGASLSNPILGVARPVHFGLGSSPVAGVPNMEPPGIR